jgi:hypothetical protein
MVFLGQLLDTVGRAGDGQSGSARRADLLEIRVRLDFDRFDGDDLFRPAVLNGLELAASTNLRLRSRLRVFGRLGQQRDVVFLDDS